MKKWKVEAKRLGKLKDVSVMVNEIMFFAGENSSGKTYLLNLLYYFYNYNLKPGLGVKLINRNHELKFILDSIEEKQTFTLSPEKINLFLSELSKELTYNLKEIKSNVYNSDVLIQKLAITFEDFKESIKIEFADEKDLMIGGAVGSVSTSPLGVQYWFRDEIKENINQMEKQSVSNSTISMIIDYLFNRIMYKYIGFEDNRRFKEGLKSVYLPAGRSTYMLLEKLITKRAYNALTNFEYDDVSQYQLQANYGVKSFLNKIVSHSNEYINKYKDLVETIENDIIGGSFSYNEISKEYQFKPTGSNRIINIQAMSSSVTELGAFTESLKLMRGLGKNLVVYEEPESHLHPAKQIKLMEVLFDFAANNYIWISSHSDFITQNINNIVKKKYLDNQLHLADETMSIYVFEKINTYSTVKKISSSKYGYKVPGFISFLKAMSKETYRLNEEISKYEEDNN